MANELVIMLKMPFTVQISSILYTVVIPLTVSALLNLDETLPERSTADGELSPAELPPTDDDLKLCPWKMPSRGGL